MKPSNGRTVWRHEESKWKPRTLQVAKVLFPAHGLHLPPDVPKYAETLEQRLERESKERKARLVARLKDADEKKERKRLRKAEEAHVKALQGKKSEHERKMEKYKKKQLRKLADIAANISKLRSEGLEYHPRVR